MTRGILYLVWPGDPRTEAMLSRSMASVKAVHPELPVHVERLPDGSSLLDKSRMFDLSPFDETLFLDADTVAMGRLDFGFEKAARHGLACCICECPWARRFGGLSGCSDIVEYNTGALFFTRRAMLVFDAWKSLAGMDSSILFHGSGGPCRMPFNDQAGFALAVDEVNLFTPFILPLNWNFRPLWQKTWFGPIKIWHDYSEPPASLAAFNAAQSAPGAVIQYARLP